MLVIRPVASNDLESLYTLSKMAQVGLTTLPKNRDILSKIINSSIPNFKNLPEKLQGEQFLFVAEDLQRKKVVGSCAVVNKVGGFQPFWTYEIRTKRHESPLLGVSKEIQYLKLKATHNGPSEIGTLFLHPDYRVSNNGRLLSLSRFLFIAEFPDCFEDTVIAEMRGVVDEKGNTVFWDAIGSHFFGVTYEKADAMTMKDKSFIEDLVPKHPIYIPLLPPEARMVIGQTHNETRPALNLLLQEGFEYTAEIDIFEAGPVLKCNRDSIRTVRSSNRVTLESVVEKPPNTRNYLVANVESPTAFRTIATPLSLIGDNLITLDREAAVALNAKVGSSLRIATLRKRIKQ